MKTWKLVVSCLVVAVLLLLLSASIFGSWIPGLVLIVLIAVFAGLTVSARLS